MRLFETSNNQPVVTTECLLIPEFKKIWDSDKSKDKTTAYKQFCYIYFMTDHKSLYNSYDTETKEEIVKRDYIGDEKWKPTKEVLAAITKYQEFQNTPTMKFLDANKNAMNSLTKYFNEIDWNELDESGKPKYKVKEVTSAVKDAGGIIDNIDKLIEKVAKEQSLGSKVRGGSVGGLMEFTEE